MCLAVVAVNSLEVVKVFQGLWLNYHAMKILLILSMKVEHDFLLEKKTQYVSWFERKFLTILWQLKRIINYYIMEHQRIN